MNFFGTTRTQVAAVVVGSVLLAHFLSILVVSLLLRAGQPASVPVISHGAATLLGELYDSGPGVRPALLDGAARAGIRLRPLGAEEASACTLVRRPPFEDERHAASRRPAKVAICSPALDDGVQTAFQTSGGTWLGVVDSLGAPPMHHPPPRPPFMLVGILAVTVATTVMLCLWASRRVTAPLLRLAEAAGQVDIEQGGTVPRTSGTREIRLLADAFNGLILRLRGYAAEQRRLVAGVSHDLRTPLTRMRLRLDQVGDQALRERLINDVQTMQIVVDSSLSLIRAQEGGAQKCDVDIGALLSTIVDNFVDSGADVDFSGPQHLKLHCDPALMTRAIENVVDNALKFAGRAEVVLRAEPRRAVIEVSDDGPGISDDQKTRVFEAFYRGDESRGATEGSGLGLAITKALVSAHGGTVDLLDAQPNGLMVRMKLPAGWGSRRLVSRGDVAARQAAVSETGARCEGGLLTTSTGPDLRRLPPIRRDSVGLSRVASRASRLATSFSAASCISSAVCSSEMAWDILCGFAVLTMMCLRNDAVETPRRGLVSGVARSDGLGRPTY